MPRDMNPFIDNYNSSDEEIANKQYKSTVFTFLFSKKKENALSLYNAVNSSQHTNVNDLEFTLLDNALYIKYREDVSFIFGSSLNLYEHQSTYNPNMPLRGLFYFADLYRRILNQSDLYRSTLLKIPVPKYIVFYNGTDRKLNSDKITMHLSDSFSEPIEPGTYEWTATMLNINPGHNSDLLSTCKLLSDYSFFIDLIRKYRLDMPLEDAIVKSIDYCIANQILSEFLSEFSKEIKIMAWNEFNEEEYYKVKTEEAYDAGYSAGHDSGYTEGHDSGFNEGIQSSIHSLAENGFPPSKISELLKISLDDVTAALI